eukprot:XP_024439947.1 senescence-associated carboxylesterase 101 [Populus trichocarpa]
MSQFPQFISGLDLANLVVSADLLQLSCGAIKDLHAETNPNQQLSSCNNPFLLRTQIHDSKTGELLLNSQLIVTGHSLGGSIASLFTLWLLDNIKRTSNRNKLPLCITFGSPLLGDQGLQRAISEHSKWNSCFLHVAANKDLFPRIFTTSQPSPRCKPFGTFFFCSELGCNCVDDPEVVSMLLRSTINQVSAEEMGIDDYSGIVKRLKSRLILREDSQLGQPVLPSLRLGIILQLKAIGVEITAEQQQQNNSINDLISELESHENRMAQQMKGIDGIEKLNRVKIKMACLEWYKKDCKAKGIGYYDSYKNLYFCSDNDVTKHKKVLTNYWRNLVEDAERKPQKEGAYMRETWLYAGTNYRRMVEPLDIAEYYRQEGKRDYQTNGRSKHYILLEQWQKEHTEKLAGAPNDKKKQNVAGSLTEDSCFWMNVEEALISCKQLKDGSNVEKQSARERLNMFEQYVMDQINNYAVSPDIFLEKSSFMNWWKDFQEIIETSHDSPLRGFMKNCRRQYEKGQF